jgi:predicted PurR-regulated permease PerM
MDLKVPESDRRWLHAILVLGTAVLALVLVAQISSILVFFSDVLLVLLLAWLLAFILSPLVSLVLRAFPQLPRVMVVGAIYISLFVGLSLIVLLVAGSLANSIVNFIGQLPDLQARLPEILAGIQTTLTNLGFQVDVVAGAQDFFARLGDLGDALVKPLTDLALFSLGIIGNLLLVIFLSLFIVLDKDSIVGYINRLVPPRYSEPVKLFEDSVSTSFGGFIRGQFIQGLVFGAWAAVVHLVFGLDFLPASAALVGVLQMIPFFGPIVSWIPPVAVAVLTPNGPVIAVLIAMGIGWFIVNNIVVPRVMSSAVGIHPIVVLIAVIIGIKIAGIAGAIFALPFAAVIASFFKYFVERNAETPRDVTTRAAKRVGDREGRQVRVPKPPPVSAGAAAGAEADFVVDSSTDDSSTAPQAAKQVAPKPVEPTA